MFNRLYNKNNYFNTKTENSVLMTPPELASYLGIGRNLAYELLKNNEIKGFRIGNQWKVSQKAVDHFITKQSAL